MPLCQEMLQAPLLSPHLEFAMRQAHEPEQTLFFGKGQLGNVRFASELSWSCGWVSVVPRTGRAHSHGLLSLLLGAPAVPTAESLVTAQRPCHAPHPISVR